MWPWGHAVVGYTVVTLASLVVRRRPLTTREAIVAVVGTQLPDLVDKPLAWTVGVLPSGRSLGHSLLVWIVVAAIVAVVVRRVGHRDLAAALLGGYLLGTVTDVPAAALAGDPSRATFLAWPVLPSPVYATEPSFLAHLSGLEAAELARAPLVLVALVLAQVLLATYAHRAAAKASKSG